MTQFATSKKLIIIIVILNFSIFLQYSKSQTTRVLFVFDASNSMKTNYNGTARIEVAKHLLMKYLDSLSTHPEYVFALRVYGSRVKYPPGDCEDSHLEIPFQAGNEKKIKEFIRNLEPVGITPIGHSLTRSAGDFPDTKAINTILLITDGIEECQGDPCLAVQSLQKKGILIKPCIIGIGLSKEQSSTLDCVGPYFDIEDPEGFRNSIQYITSQKAYKTTSQVNLLNVSSKPTETNVNMSFTDESSGKIFYNFVHSLNYKGYPDTLPLAIFPVYSLTVYTIPCKTVDGIKITAGTHNTIPVDVPQGNLLAARSSGIYDFNDQVKCLVRESGATQTLHVCNLNNSEKYLVGKYDLEILTLPRTYALGNTVQQSVTNSLVVLDAGQVKITTSEYGDGCILKENGKELIWVCDLLSNATHQEFNLQPGFYKVTFRSKSSKQSIYTLEKRIIISSNKQTQLNFSR